MFWFIIIAAIIIAWIEAPSLVRNKQWKDLSVFSGFLALGIVLGAVLDFQLPFPNPTKGIEALFKPVTEAFFGKG
ncbi:hypothetical protein [Paenibacillus sp. UNC451MF]|uniref:hypothetical protein n=1 Tax=Paenibacillus sp. UNC451MF TaxID=1449063 RepID=UPI00048E16A4|nr:hypothetical protein [Paenibacillus sp. UNC451MF]